MSLSSPVFHDTGVHLNPHHIMKVIDNFLPDNVFQQISDNVMGEMPWTFLDTVSHHKEKIKLQNFFHVHQVYEKDTPLSQAFGLLTPFFGIKDLI